VSVGALIDDYLTRHYEGYATNLGLERTAGQAETLGERTMDYLSQLAKYIPAEILSAYIPVLNFIPADAVYVQWALYTFFAVITPVFVWLRSFKKYVRKKKHGEAFAVPWFTMTAALLAFLIWAMALPGSLIIHLRLVPAWLTSVLVILMTIILSIANEVITAFRLKNRTSR
jgi:hypothetical protein